MSLFAKVPFGFLPGSPGDRVLPVLFGAGLTSAAVGERRVGAAPALAGFPGCLAVLASALPVVFLSLGRLIPGPVVFPTLFEFLGRVFRLRVFRCPLPLDILSACITLVLFLGPASYWDLERIGQKLCFCSLYGSAWADWHPASTTSPPTSTSP